MNNFLTTQLLLKTCLWKNTHIYWFNLCNLIKIRPKNVAVPSRIDERASFSSGFNDLADAAAAAADDDDGNYQDG